MLRLALRISFLTLSMSVFSTFALPDHVIQYHSATLDKRQMRAGRATWYYPGLGNCGITNTQDEPIVAISKQLYDAHGGSDCGQQITITNTNTGQTATDLSPSLFQQLAPLDDGVVPVSWTF
ncbi:hypothetical protein CPB84DRAFT_1787814 [Gymnopilus junonius]|uniref:Barwin domain-containing protein n=1 Tax=Gymnopilus junonius TaxID=109634 RepID=A0A9P5NI54_GYMJU|nr:hypothetical protein CPB84DRAFT_1787814 [Gymnopilus junonius]